MAAKRAKMLQMPKDVDLKSLGKIVMLTIVSTLQAAATPSLEPKRNKGMRLG